MSRASFQHGRRCQSQAGIALVELAAILPILLLLVFAAMEFAHALARYADLVEQTRLATRYLTTKVPGEGQIEAKCLAVYGTAAPTCGGTPMVEGLKLEHITVLDASVAGSQATHRANSTGSDDDAVIVNLVTVRLSGYSHELIAGGILTGVFSNRSSIMFNDISLTMRQQL
jgi:hypothetical protein